MLVVKHFHHYLFGQKFTVRTDHGSLQWLMRFKNCEGQIARWIETLSTYTFTVVHRAGRVHNNADSLSRRPCHNDHCKFCDRYEKRYSSETLAETNKYANETGAVKTIDFGSENKLTLPILGSNKQVTQPCIESDKFTLLCTGGEHKFTLPSIGGEHGFTESDHGITLSDVGNFQDHKPCDSYYCQEKTAAHIGPISTDDSGSIALTTTSLGHGVAEVLSKEMPPGTTQIGVPHFRHTTPNSVCDGVDAEAHKIVNGRHVHCCCCRSICEMSAKNTGDWWDHLEDGTLFGCLFEAGENPEEMYVAHAGMATTQRLVMTSPGVLACRDLQW